MPVLAKIFILVIYFAICAAKGGRGGIFMDNTYIITVIVVILVILLIIKGIYDDKKYKRRVYTHIKNTWGKPSRKEYSNEVLEAIKYYYNQNASDGDVDNITCNDLDMDAVFAQANHTMTSIGEEYLYALLRKPVTDISVLKEREDTINFIQADEEERIKLQIALSGMGKLDKIPVYSYVERIRDMDTGNKIYHICCGAALTASICLCMVKPAIMVLITALLVIHNVLMYYKSKAKTDPYIKVFTFIARTIRQSESIAGTNIKGLGVYNKRLVSCVHCFKKFSRNNWLVSCGGMSGSILDSLMDYIRILFHVDLVKIANMACELKKHEKELMEIYNITGYIDSMVSIASFRAGAGSWCVPGLFMAQNKREITMEFKGLYHPLIDHPVKNSASVKKSVLITGSNASGKSVFIKTVAINAIFAQTIHTVLADSYNSCFFNIYSSMALRDDIFCNESYYIVEIKSLKRIIDRTGKADIPVLCFIDEVLRGTNTLERIASSSQILKHISEANAMCFAATHDLELAKILSGGFDNYHFEETVKENNVTFDYKLRKGTTNTRNAIKLLDMTGYNKEITNGAERAAQFFLENGFWPV